MAPLVRILEIDAFERDVQLRMPFRFGGVTVMRAPQAFVRVRVAGADGKSAIGCAAEMMVPKWFDKISDLTPDQNVDQLRASIRVAAFAALETKEAATLFSTARRNEQETQRRLGENWLVAGFGPALIARAALDAWCRLVGVCFFDAVSRNLIGMTGEFLPKDIAAERAGTVLATLHAAPTIAARHTIGLLDPITEADIAHPLHDGLPQSLEAVIARYGHRWFKIKLAGEIDADMARLERIAAVLKRVPGYQVTLDGNEQFAAPEVVADLLARVTTAPALAPLNAAIAYIEQPLPRAITLDTPLGALGTRLPFLIDESDDGDEAFGRAVALGYRGVSSKTCKGIYRSLLKAIRVQGTPGLFLSGEDLTCQAGISVQQDLALVSLLGLSNVERNGHHYVDGMQGASADEMDRFAAAHPDLYQRDPTGLHLRIVNGEIATASLASIGYASGALPDFDTMRPLS